MKAPVFAAFAPGVLVVGRMVSAISSRYATSSLVKASPPVAAGFSVLQPVIQAVLPISAAPPSSALTRSTACRRVIISGVSRTAVSLSVIGRLRSDVAAFELVHREVRGARGERHIGERRVYAGGRHHARPIGDEYVLRIPDLVVRVEHGRLGIASHARGTHLVNSIAGEIPGVVNRNV